MVRSSTAHGSHGSSNHDRRLDFPVRHVRNVGSLLHDLSDGFESEVKEYFVDYRSSAGHRCANRGTRGPEFADARVAQPIVTEFFPQPAGLTKISTAGSYALPDIDNTRVSAHFLAQSFDSRIRVCDDTALL